MAFAKLEVSKIIVNALPCCQQRDQNMGERYSLGNSTIITGSNSSGACLQQEKDDERLDVRIAFVPNLPRRGREER